MDHSIAFGVINYYYRYYYNRFMDPWTVSGDYKNLFPRTIKQ